MPLCLIVSMHWWLPLAWTREGRENARNDCPLLHMKDKQRTDTLPSFSPECRWIPMEALSSIANPTIHHRHSPALALFAGAFIEAGMIGDCASVQVCQQYCTTSEQERLDPKERVLHGSLRRSRLICFRGHLDRDTNSVLTGPVHHSTDRYQIVP